MAKGAFVPFEKSAKDKEKKGLKEGSPKELAADKKQAKAGGKKAVPPFLQGKGKR